jgi:cytochrome c-type biogenesis protein CcmE
MGVLEGVRRFLHRVAESDEERLREEILAWASGVPGAVRIADAPMRTPVRLAGVVKRITVHPEHGLEALEAVITDGSGEISVLWMGRRKIPGLTLGSRIVVEGVIGEHRHGRRMVNPSFEFSA